MLQLIQFKVKRFISKISYMFGGLGGKHGAGSPDGGTGGGSDQLFGELSKVQT